MKTVIVTFGNSKKRYSFITKENLKAGDVIRSKAYDTFIRVVMVLDKEYSYVDGLTGTFLKECTTANCIKLKELVLNNDENDVIYFDFCNER